MEKFNVTMGSMMIDWYENNRRVLDESNYYLDVTSLALDYPIEFRDGMGFIIEGKEFEDNHQRRRDKLFLNMNMFTTTVLNPRSFVMQDHEAYNHLHYYRELMNDPVIRRFFFSYISVATREIQETSPIIEREKLVKNTMRKVHGNWIAPATPWEQHLARFLIIDNLFIAYLNEFRDDANITFYNSENMRAYWLPYRSADFCQELWSFYEREIQVNRVQVYEDDSDGILYLVDNYVKYEELMSWVHEVICDVQRMEASLPVEKQLVLFANERVLE